MKFENESKRLTKEQVEERAFNRDTKGYYGYDTPSKYLLQWSRLFQSVISHAGSYLCSGEFTKGECGIYKSEGGCKINGVGDLVLREDRAYWDYGRDKKCDKLNKVTHLITEVVLAWDPMDPIESMLSTAAKIAGTTPEDLKAAIEKNAAGGVFGGDALSSFFNRNPFSREEPDYTYLRFCRVNINKADPKQVDQEIADRKLGSQLLEKMVKKAVSAEGKNGGYMPRPLCCSPRRDDKGLKFWVNTGANTKIDGWIDEKTIQEYLKSDGKLEREKRG